jgi:hypothetical protein
MYEESASGAARLSVGRTGYLGGMVRGLALVVLAAALIPDVKGKDGDFTFKVTPGGSGAPCVSFDGPSESGGNCFVAVVNGGWALEAEYTASKRDVVFFGAAIGRARKIRIGRVATIGKLRWSKRYHLRLFAARVPRRAVHVQRNKIVALDKRGRLLGRQHYRDRHRGYGRCDGLWDRRHCPT